MDGWIDNHEWEMKWMNKWMDRWMDRCGERGECRDRRDGWVDGRMWGSGLPSGLLLSFVIGPK